MHTFFHIDFCSVVTWDQLYIFILVSIIYLVAFLAKFVFIFSYIIIHLSTVLDHATKRVKVQTATTLKYMYCRAFTFWPYIRVHGLRSD